MTRAALIALVVLAGCKQRPCVRTEPSVCESSYCSMWLPVQVGDVTVMNCFAWTTDKYQCHRCVEWGPEPK